MTERITTNKKDDYGTTIHVGDLVSLVIPRKPEENLLGIFQVVQHDDKFKLVAYNDSVHPTDPKYIQELGNQVYKVIGNIIDGIDHNLLE